MTDKEIIDSHIAYAEESGPDMYPQLGTLSAAFIYQFTPVARRPAHPEVVFMPKQNLQRAELVGLLASWNHLWEAAQFRKDVFKKGRFIDSMPQMIAWIDRLPQANIYLVPETKTNYDAYCPLYALLPKPLLDRHGIPALRRPLWPTNHASPWMEQPLPADYTERLSRAFAEHVWRFLDSGSGLRAFNLTEPLTLLSHSLDYWLPHAVAMVEDRMREFSRAEPETSKQRRMLAKASKHADGEGFLARPRRGGILWMGEEEAAYAMEEVVNAADASGRLRGLVDAIKSNRVVDDFSPQWSFAREDFERKLYSKRSKIKISFVELSDTLPVHSARSEYTDNLIWQDFSSILNTRERHIVVCLRNGTNNLGDISARLGYANHSPISKALTKIRKKASAFLNLN